MRVLLSEQRGGTSLNNNDLCRLLCFHLHLQLQTRLATISPATNMKPFSLLSFALAAAANPLLSTRVARPKPPTVSLLFSANITIDDPIFIGQTPFGFEVIVQVTGGAFKGPKLAGAHLLPSKLPLYRCYVLRQHRE